MGLKRYHKQIGRYTIHVARWGWLPLPPFICRDCRHIALDRASRQKRQKNSPRRGGAKKRRWPEKLARFIRIIFGFRI